MNQKKSRKIRRQLEPVVMAELVKAAKHDAIMELAHDECLSAIQKVADKNFGPAFADTRSEFLVMAYSLLAEKGPVACIKALQYPWLLARGDYK